jgi:prepilin-type N-terminal cleavage/methylation domain-containing protein
VTGYATSSRAFTLPKQRARGAFTLIELMVVIGIIVIISVMLVPAFTAIKGASDTTNGAYTIAGMLEQARNYAMSNNTFAYVGFYEEATTNAAPTNAPPPYPGKGRLVLAAVASKDGTTSCEDPASTTAARIPLIASLITQVGKLVKIENVHMADVGAPPSPTTADSTTLAGRPDLPYSFGSPADYQNRISSDDTHTPFNQTLYPFVTQGYTFYKTVRFGPTGEANINSTYSLKRVAEIGLIPTRGDFVTATSKNAVAIQFSGIGGNFKIYRQ